MVDKLEEIAEKELDRSDFILLINQMIQQNRSQERSLLSQLQTTAVYEQLGYHVRYYLTPKGLTYSATKKDSIGFRGEVK